jgi:hypothetical protein
MVAPQVGVDARRCDDKKAAKGRRFPVRQRIVHHATHRSPFNLPFTIPREWPRRDTRSVRLVGPNYQRAACLSVRLSGV